MVHITDGVFRREGKQPGMPGKVRGGSDGYHTLWCEGHVYGMLRDDMWLSVEQPGIPGKARGCT
eukprot:scaffold32821_cov19-Tisochrysis_lutea.AAC.2